MKFAGKVVVITGASSGIGAELAHQLGRQGAKLVLASRDEARLQSIASQYADVLVVPTDVSIETDCHRLIDQTIKKFGRIDVLVNNAGISMWAYFDQITDTSLFERIMQVNYLGSVYCTYYALPYLKQSQGLIVAVSSLTGKTGVPTRSAYSASKHAMQGFFDSLRIELLGSGVDVLVVSPGFVQTEVRQRGLGADGKPRGESHLDEQNVIPVDECVRQMLDGMAKRKREVIVASFRLKFAQILKVFAPKLVDRLALKSIESGRT